jgi:hypothetical protein
MAQQYSRDILPPELDNIDQFLENRDAVIKEIRKTKGDRDGDAYKRASAFYTSLDGIAWKLINLAHFEVLRRNFEHRQPLLFALALGALIGLGTFAVFGGGKTDVASRPDGKGATRLLLTPGSGWTEVANALTVACGDAPLPAQIKAGESQSGWVELQLLGPPACAGVELSLPTRVVAEPSVSRSTPTSLQASPPTNSNSPHPSKP